MLCALVLSLTTSASAFSLTAQECRSSYVATRTASPQMINLFGNNEESKKRRADLSLRSAPVGSRKVVFRKPNSATQGLQLGLKFKETLGKAVIIDDIIPNTEAARLEKSGQIKKGDEIVMVSATFGDEMWSARGVGKYRLEKSIAVRQGMTISFVVEGRDAKSKQNAKALAEKQAKENARMSRLQKELAAEVEAQKKQGGSWKFW